MTRKPLYLTLILTLIACGPSEDDLRSEQNMGYLSTLAVELSVNFSGVIDLPPDKSPEEGVKRQFEFVGSLLDYEGLHLNPGTIRITEARIESQTPTFDRIKYMAEFEVIVTHEELRDHWGIEDPRKWQPQRTHGVRVPQSPWKLRTLHGLGCADGYNRASEVTDEDYDWYFDPDLPDCAIPLTRVDLVVEAPLARGLRYPEYDRLIADNKITAAILFGAAHHPIEEDDAGVLEQKQLVESLFRRGYLFDRPLDHGGLRFELRQGGLTVQVDLYAPGPVDRLEQYPGRLERIIRDNELLFYLGHTGSGTLRAFKNPDFFPADTYQIFFLGSCWSRWNYTEAIFDSKASTADPTGRLDVDVVNNINAGWFSNLAEYADILLAGLLEGALRDGKMRSWRTLIDRMNRHSLKAYEAAPDKDKYYTPELFGVSGVEHNRFKPTY